MRRLAACRSSVSSLPFSTAMTRSDLVEELAARFSQLTHRDAEYAVKTILDAMSDALVRGHRIEIRGFGSFSINRRPPRMGRNPRSRRKRADPRKAGAALQAGQGPARSGGRSARPSSRPQAASSAAADRRYASSA